ncbi:YHS domain-containing protein [Myxococcota bacterium]|nr:YHS domain-containing protein [Myxococcota bacterium]MBU1537020.1 YHS domain-containing protein [Myxococcota bacterium]
MTAVNVEEPHVPCGRHGSTAKHTGELFPSVFKTPPKPGIKVSCPIKGETFVLTDKHPRTVYKGKTYIFGCNGCKRIFLRDPEAALKKYTFKEAL